MRDGLMKMDGSHGTRGKPNTLPATRARSVLHAGSKPSTVLLFPVLTLEPKSYRGAGKMVTVVRHLPSMVAEQSRTGCVPHASGCALKRF